MPQTLQNEINRVAAGYPNPIEFFVRKLAEGISTITAAFAPQPVIVRLSDFKSNEYANMLGGETFEPRGEKIRCSGFAALLVTWIRSFAPALISSVVH
ncbi:MAG: hypothetical protein CM1200mP41_07900 [Gammaproteobacteria bacterium]|nr:MAG: hypothetical protein CM1200mP41_07900 [Gammaproteobacteria bacterium]